MKIGEKLSILKQERDLSDRGFATVVGGHLSTISKILRGDENRKLTHEQLLRISRNWGVTVESLMDDDEEMVREIPGLNRDELALLWLIRGLGSEEARRRLTLETIPVEILHRLAGVSDKGTNPIDWGKIEVRAEHRKPDKPAPNVDGNVKTKRPNDNQAKRG